MPFLRKTNNSIIPANSRAVDVAKQTLERVTPIQQRRYANAFEVNGYETLVYNRLRHGTVCSCQGSRRAAATILGEDGKLKPGQMEKLLTGGLSFKVQPYGTREPMRTDVKQIRGGKPNAHEDQMYDGAEDGKHLADFDLEDDFDNPNTTVTHAGSDVDDNSDANILDHDDGDEYTDFDGDSDVNDTKCAVCFGTGWVGGFSLLNGSRIVLSTQWPNMSVVGTVEINRYPHAFMASSVTFDLILPKGVIGVDAFRVWNNDLQIPTVTIYVDGLAYNVGLIRALCDGLSHTITVEFERLTMFTHIELQFNLSTTRALFELPRKTDGSTLSLTEPADDMQLNCSPAIPALFREDVLVECTLGKALIVQSVTDWKTRNRDIFGWDCNVRVLQPAELLNILPRRQLMGQKTTCLVRDNIDGHRRI